MAAVPDPPRVVEEDAGEEVFPPAGHGKKPGEPVKRPLRIVPEVREGDLPPQPVRRGGAELDRLDEIPFRRGVFQLQRAGFRIEAALYQPGLLAVQAFAAVQFQFEGRRFSGEENPVVEGEAAPAAVAAVQNQLPAAGFKRDRRLLRADGTPVGKAVFAGDDQLHCSVDDPVLIERFTGGNEERTLFRRNRLEFRQGAGPFRFEREVLRLQIAQLEIGILFSRGLAHPGEADAHQLFAVGPEADFELPPLIVLHLRQIHPEPAPAGVLLCVPGGVFEDRALRGGNRVQRGSRRVADQIDAQCGAGVQREGGGRQEQ